jgi:hypothetical protein
MTDDYDLQLAMMEKRVTDKSNPLTVNEIRDDLNLTFKRLTEKQKEQSENDNNQEVAFLVVNLKENIEIVVQSSIKRKDCKLKTNQNGGQNSGNRNKFQKNTSNGAYFTYCCQSGHTMSNSFRLKNEFKRKRGTSNNDGQGYRVFIFQ